VESPPASPYHHHHHHALASSGWAIRTAGWSAVRHSEPIGFYVWLFFHAFLYFDIFQKVSAQSNRDSDRVMSQKSPSGSRTEWTLALLLRDWFR
jgi:hypothetical protein